MSCYKDVLYAVVHWFAALFASLNESTSLGSGNATALSCAQRKCRSGQVVEGHLYGTEGVTSTLAHHLLHYTAVGNKETAFHAPALVLTDMP